MDDNFENFISGNRDKFDIHEPPEGLWKRIESNLKLKNRTGRYRIMVRVAGIAAIFLLAFLVSEIIHRRNMAREFSNLSAGDIAPMQLKDAEAYYIKIIDDKMDEIEPIISECPGLKKELQLDFTELDNIYSELKSDLRENIASQEVIKAIIENYRFRINILEDMLIELEPDSNECLPNTDEYEL